MKAAQMDYCWSAEIQRCLAELGGISAGLCREARVANGHRDGTGRDQSIFRHAQSEVWSLRDDIRQKAEEIRVTIRKELLEDGP